MKPTDANRPLRVLQKVLGGGLGRGNLGVVVARHGTGKVAVLTCITLDHAMEGRNTLHISVGKPVADIRAYDDEVLNAICDSYDLADRASIKTKVERHKQIYSFADGRFAVERLAQVLGFLAEHAEFKPDLIEIQGWPRFREVDPDEIAGLKRLAVDAACEIWLTAHLHRDDECDERGIPLQVTRYAEHLSVLMALEPSANNVPIRFVQVHGSEGPENVNLEFDPRSMLIRWR